MVEGRTYFQGAPLSQEVIVVDDGSAATVQRYVRLVMLSLHAVLLFAFTLIMLWSFYAFRFRSPWAEGS